MLGVHCSLGHTDLVSLLLEYGAQAGPEEVRAACAGGHVNILELLAQCGAEAAIRSEDNLVEAARGGNITLILSSHW